MKAYFFPGQGAQFVGMGKNLYEQSEEGRKLFEQANNILGFRITYIMFEGTAEDLKETKVTQPAIFLHSVILASVLGENLAGWVTLVSLRSSAVPSNMISVM